MSSPLKGGSLFSEFIEDDLSPSLFYVDVTVDLRVNCTENPRWRLVERYICLYIYLGRGLGGRMKVQRLRAPVQLIMGSNRSLSRATSVSLIVEDA